MPIHRRNFMKLLGVSVASLYLARCRSPFVTTSCYLVVLSPTPGPPLTNSPAHQRLRLYWLRFDELAQKSRTDAETSFREELVSGHRLALDELVASLEVAAPVADLVQEAYEAAVFHVWRSNIPATCYDMSFNYSFSSADVLVKQTTVLNQIAETGTVDPATLEKAQAALEHDMAFYALTDEELQVLYDKLGEQGRYPSFEDVSLELTPEAQAATQFIVDLLTAK